MRKSYTRCRDLRRALNLHHSMCILCHWKESGHASLASQWQGVIRTAKIQETVFLPLILPHRGQQIHSHYMCTHSTLKLCFYVQSHSAQVKSAPAQTAYFNLHDSFTQSDAR